MSTTSPFQQPTLDSRREERLDGLKMIVCGVGAFLISLVALWLSFYLVGKAKTILGAGSLLGGALIGAGLVQSIIGKRLAVLRWIVGVVGALLGVGATLFTLELTLGIRFY